MVEVLYATRPNSDRYIERNNLYREESFPSITSHFSVLLYPKSAYINRYGLNFSNLSSNINKESLHQRLIESILVKIGLPRVATKEIEKTIDSIRKLLLDYDIVTEISPSLFTDPEVKDWEELRLTISIDKERYKPILEDRIIDTIINELPDKLARKIIIDVRQY